METSPFRNLDLNTSVVPPAIETSQRKILFKIGRMSYPVSGTQQGATCQVPLGRLPLPVSEADLDRDSHDNNREDAHSENEDHILTPFQTHRFGKPGP